MTAGGLWPDLSVFAMPHVCGKNAFTLLLSDIALVACE